MPSADLVVVCRPCANAGDMLGIAQRAAIEAPGSSVAIASADRGDAIARSMITLQGIRT